jgi:hypothetical protein
MVATGINVTPPDELKHPSVKIVGRIRAAGHKFAYRQCRGERLFRIRYVRITGAVREEGYTYPTKQSGRFEYGPTDVPYGGTDSLGFFSDGLVPYEGGNATFLLNTPKVKVPKDKLGIRTYTCRPLRLTLEVPIPPIPGGPP